MAQSKSKIRTVLWESAGYWFAPGVLLLVFSLAIRSRRFGFEAALSARSILETASAALLLIGFITFVQTRKIKPYSKVVLSSIAIITLLSIETLGTILTTLLRLPLDIRLVQWIPDTVFIDSSFTDTEWSSLIYKSAAALFVGSVVGIVISVAGRNTNRRSWMVSSLPPIVASLALALSASMLTSDPRSRDRDPVVSFVSSLFESTFPDEPKHIDYNSISFSETLGKYPKQARKRLIQTNRKSANIVLVVLETGVWQVCNDPKVMPNLYNLKQNNSVNYNQHFSTAPSSTRSLFSINTGLYPQPSVINEPRHSWAAPWPSLPENMKRAGYETACFTAYDNRFERNGDFFEALGYDTVEDMNSLEMKRLTGMPCGDDRLAYAALNKWLNDGHSKPKFAMIILANTHFPFYSPEHINEFDKSNRDGRFKNSMLWQDKILGNFIDKTSALDCTLLITADHGAPFGIISSKDDSRESAIRVPLTIHDNNRIDGNYNINIPTSHVDIASTVLSLAGGSIRGTQGSDLTSLPGKNRAIYHIFSYDRVAVGSTRNGRITWSDGQSSQLFGVAKSEDKGAKDRIALFTRYQYWKLQDIIFPD